MFLIDMFLIKKTIFQCSNVLKYISKQYKEKQRTAEEAHVANIYITVIFYWDHTDKKISLAWERIEFL